jgi:hypothetical protein
MPEQHLQHAAEIGLVAEDLGPATWFDLHTCIGRYLHEEGGHVDASAAGRDGYAAGALVEVRKHAHDVVERIERRLDVARRVGTGFGARRRAFRAGPTSRVGA